MNPDFDGCPACLRLQRVEAAERGECCVICHQPFHAPGEAPEIGSAACWRCRPPRTINFMDWPAQRAVGGREAAEEKAA